MEYLIKKINKSNKISYAFLFILVGSLILRDIFSITVNKFIIFGLCSLMILNSSEDNLSEFICFLLPLMSGLPSTYVLLLIVIVYIIEGKFNKYSIGISFFIILIELINCLRIEASFDSNVIKQILFMIVFFLMIYDHTKINYLNCMKMFFYGTLLVCFIIITYSIMRAPNDWLYLFSKGWYRFGDVALEEVSSMTLRLNSNSLAYISLAGLMVGLVIIQYIKENKFIFKIGLLFLFVSGLLSLSRSWILVLLIIFVLYGLSLLKSKVSIKSIFKIVVFFILFSSFIFFLYVNMGEIIEGFSTRLMRKDIIGGNGRINLSLEYIDAYLQADFFTILFGSGASNYKIIYNMMESIHAGFLQIIVCYGIIGGLFFILFMFLPLFNNRKTRFLYYLPLLSVLLFTQTIQFINPPYLMMPYIVAIYCINLGKQKRIRFDY